MKMSDRLVTFVPEMKGKPGKIAMWQYPGVDTPVTSRSSFRAQVSELRPAAERCFRRSRASKLCWSI